MSHTNVPLQLYLVKTTMIFDKFGKFIFFSKLYRYGNSCTLKVDLRFGIIVKQKCETFKMWLRLKKCKTFAELNLFCSSEDEGITPLEVPSW